LRLAKVSISESQVSLPSLLVEAILFEPNLAATSPFSQSNSSSASSTSSHGVRRRENSVKVSCRFRPFFDEDEKRERIRSTIVVGGR